MADKQDHDDTYRRRKCPNDPRENSFRSVRQPEPETSKYDRNNSIEKEMQKVKLDDYGETSNYSLKSLDRTDMNDATSYYSVGNLAISHDNNKTPYKSAMVYQAQQKEFGENRECNMQQAGGNPPYFDNEIPCDKKTLKIVDINADVFFRACNLLNIYRIQGNDWRSLAGRLEYSVTDVKIFEESKDKGGCTGAMLCDWSTKEHHYIEDVVKELKEMERADVVQLLQQEIEKKGDSCNCVDCGHLV